MTEHEAMTLLQRRASRLAALLGLCVAAVVVPLSIALWGYGSAAGASRGDQRLGIQGSMVVLIAFPVIAWKVIGLVLARRRRAWIDELVRTHGVRRETLEEFLNFSAHSGD